MWGPELEFLLCFNWMEKGAPTLVTNDKAAYFDLPPVDKGEEALMDMGDSERMGFEIEASHHEVRSGSKHEIDFKYQEALTTADNIVTFRMVVIQ